METIRQPGRAVLEAGRGTAALMAAQAVTVLAGLGTHAVCIRELGLADYGRFATVNLLGMCGSLLLISGIPQAVRMAAAAGPIEGSTVRRWVLCYHLPLTLGLTAASGLFSPLIARALNDPGLATLLLLSAAEVTARAGVFEPWVLFLNASGRQRAQAFAQGGYGFARFLVVGGGLAAGGGVTGAVGCYALTAVLGAVVGTVGLFGGPYRGPVRRPPDRQFGRQVRAALGSTIGYDLLPFLLPGISIWLLQVSGHDPEFVGFLSACVMASTPLVALGAGVGAGVFPHVARGTLRSDAASRRAIVALAVRVLLIADTAIIACVVARGGAIARLLSNSAVATGTVLAAIVIGSACLGATKCFADVLAAGGQVGFRLRLTLGLVVGHTAASVSLLAACGAVGAAWAIVCSTAVGVVASAGLTWGLLGPYATLARLLRILTSAAALGCTLFLCPQPGSVVTTLAQLVLGLLAYLVALFCLGEIRWVGMRPWARRPGGRGDSAKLPNRVDTLAPESRSDA